MDIYPFRHGKMNKVSLSGFPTATTIPYTTRQSEVCALKRIYRFLIGMYATSSNTFLYAGRIMRLPSKFNSSLRCAHQPTIRAMANSGVIFPAATRSFHIRNRSKNPHCSKPSCRCSSHGRKLRWLALPAIQGKQTHALSLSRGQGRGQVL